MKTVAVFLAIFVVALSGAFGGSASNGGQQQTGTIQFSSKTQLVTVPVIVTRSGQHVTGLTRQDFQITQDGQQQTIAGFEEVTTKPPALPALPNAPRPVASEFSNIGPTYPTRFTIIALDLAQTEMGDQRRARQGILKFLQKNITAREPISLVAVSRTGLHLIHPFTSDPAILVAALAKVSSSIPSADPASPVAGTVAWVPDTQTADGFFSADVEAQRITSILNGPFTNDPFASFTHEQALFASTDAVTMLARAYAGMPGRKSLIWVGATPPFPPRSEWAESTPGAPALTSNATLDRKFAQAILELKNANMAVYPVDAVGLSARPPQIESPAARYSAAGRVKGGFGANTPSEVEDLSIAARQKDMAASAVRMREPKQDMRWIAETTGGRAIVNSNDIAGSIDRAMDDSTQYYQLTYYLSAGTKPGWHKIAVKVNQERVEVRARSGVLVDNLATRSDAQSDVAQAIGSPMDLTGVPVVVNWTGQGGSAGEPKRVSFAVTLPPNSILIDEADNNHMNVEVSVLASNAERKVVGAVKRNFEGHLTTERLAQFAKAGLNFSSSVNMEPGRYSVRFLVRDTLSGRVGTVTAPLLVE